MDNSPNNKQHWLLKLLVSMVALVSWIIYRHMPQEEREKVDAIVAVRMHAATHAFIDFIIPHERNGYKPKVFQARSVKHIVLIVILIKVGLISALFTLYPNFGRLQQDIQSQMYELTNQYRVEKGGHSLAINAYLEEAATAKGTDMLAQNYFSHYGPDGKKPWQWLDPVQYDFKAMGENLGMDYLTAGSVFKAFQNSPTHDKNLLNPAYNEMGIATLNGYLDGHSTNLMVVFFGTRKETVTKVAEAPTTVAPVAQEVPPAPAPAPAPIPKPVSPQPKPIAPAPQPAPIELVPVQNPTETIPSKIAALEPEIEVLGEAVSNDQGQIIDQFKGGVVFSKGNWLQRSIAWANRFLFMFLLTLMLLLVVNIVVKVRVQHAHIILNAMLLIVVVTGALYLQVHAAEAIGEHIRILGSIFIR